MRNRPFAFLIGIVLPAALAACGGGPEPAAPTPAIANEWRFTAEEHVALWYHGLALADVGTSGAEAVPIYRAGYASEMQSARGRTASPITATTGARLESAGAADGLQFLPLYFGSWEQMRQAVDIWNQAGGDPNRSSDPQTQAVIAFLSQRFGTSSQRAAVVEFVNALEQERASFFAAWWRDNAPTALGEETQTLWRSYQPRFTAFLRYSDAEGGHAALTPALRGEGRVESAPGVAVAAIGGRAGDDPHAIIGRVIHELSYSLAAEAVRDAVAPARIREIGEDVLVARAAVRAGALVLERIAPDLLPAYTDDYIRAAGGEPARSTLVQQFDLPNELVEPLRDAVRIATAGI